MEPGEEIADTVFVLTFHDQQPEFDKGVPGQGMRISGFFAPVAHVDAVGGALADGVDPAQEPLTGVGLDLNLLSDELVGQGAGVIVASAESALLRQLTGPPAAKRRSLGGGGGCLCVLG